MDDSIDLLKMKIERAKEALPKETRAAIESVPWREAIYSIRERKGYNLTQLEDLELETELVLCGLVPPANYPMELSNRMGISAPLAQALVEEMNELVFKKIREEMVKRINTNSVFDLKDKNSGSGSAATLEAQDQKQSTVDIKIIKEAIAKKEEDKNLVNTILGQKLSGTHISPKVNTEYSLGNISRKDGTTTPTKSDWVDPYRLNPGE